MLLTKRSTSYLYWAIIFILLLSPIPFGGSRDWALLLLMLLTMPLMLLWIVFRIKILPEKIIDIKALHKLLLCLLIFCFLAYLQTTVISSPFSYNQLLVDRVAADTRATMEVIIRYIFYALIFIIVAIGSLKAQRAKLQIHMICYLLAGYSFIAIIMFYHDNTRVLWQEKLAHIDDLTGFFFNRNSFATLIGMGIISTLALLVHKYHKSLASNRVVFFNTANIYLLLGLLVQISAIMLTNSRAGILTTLIGVLTVIALYGLRGRFQQMKKVFLLLLIIAPIILLMGQSKLISRLTNTDLSQELRPVIWQKTLQGIAAQPVFGHGLGNFRYGFSPYHDTTLKMKVFRAHNDYLELFFEMGLFAPFLLFWVFFCIVKRCFNGALKRNKHQLYSIIACGVSSQIALHSLVDFSLQIPAVAIFALIIIAIGYSQSYNTKSLLSISRS